MDLEPPPDEDYFAYWCVDVKKNGAPAWGMKLQMRDTTCMRVMAVTEEDGSPIHEWNKRCLGVFPSDQVKVDDQIFRVNGETDPICFQAILVEAEHILTFEDHGGVTEADEQNEAWLAMRRTTASEPC